MIKTKVAFWRAGFYPANQSNLKSYQKALIGWNRPALQNSHFCFDHVNRLITAKPREHWRTFHDTTSELADRIPF